MISLSLVLLCSSIFLTVYASKATVGGACLQTDSHLQIGTYQFTDDCDLTTYCAANNTCVPKGCRRDQYPFGYSQNDFIPPLCPKGQFCPDEEDACQDLLTVGSQCQLNRDDECEAPPNYKDLQPSQPGQNFNGSVCLNFQCTWQNATLGSKCVVENTAYIAYGENDQEFIDIVSRGNCSPGLYCDSQQLLCLQQRAVGDSCTADKECTTNNCLSSQVCGNNTASPDEVATFVYVVVGIGIFGGMFGTLVALYFLHKKQREKEHQKRVLYWREQDAFRQNILRLRETANASMTSLPLTGNLDSARSTFYSRDHMSDDSHLPMLRQQNNGNKKSSGLVRNTTQDEGLEQVDYTAPYVKERESDLNRIAPAPRAF